MIPSIKPYCGSKSVRASNEYSLHQYSFDHVVEKLLIGTDNLCWDMLAIKKMSDVV